MCQFQCTVPFPLFPLVDAVRQLVKTVTFEVLTDSKHNLYEDQKYADADMDRACSEMHMFKVGKLQKYFFATQLHSISDTVTTCN